MLIDIRTIFKRKTKRKTTATKHPTWLYGIVASLISTAMTHPINLIRVNMQANAIEYVSSKQIILKMLKYRGIRGFFFNLPSGMLRSLMQSGSRFMLIDAFQEFNLLEANPDIEHFGIATVSGIASALVSMPFTKVSTIMQADLARDATKRRNFPNVPVAFKNLYRKGGISYLYQGIGLYTFVNITIAIGQLSISKKIKKLLIEQHMITANWKLLLYSSTITTSIVALALTPVVVLKNVIINAEHRRYICTLEAYKHLKQVHGYRGFTIGYRPTVLGFLPHSFIVAYIYEALYKHYTVENSLQK